MKILPFLDTTKDKYHVEYKQKKNFTMALLY